MYYGNTGPVPFRPRSPRFPSFQALLGRAGPFSATLLLLLALWHYKRASLRLYTLSSHQRANRLQLTMRHRRQKGGQNETKDTLGG
jgi:hypothetical protein